jgi:hypothetical protein
MKPKQLLNDYLRGGLTGEELRTLLANDKSREAGLALAILNMDDNGRKALGAFSSPPGAAERLAEKVASIESWVETQAQERPPSRNWFQRLIPAMDVVGHNQAQKTRGRPEKSKATRKTRSKRASPPRTKNNK